MKTRIMLAAALSLAIALPSLAQEGQGMDHDAMGHSAMNHGATTDGSAETATLAACLAAGAKAEPTAGMMEGMNDLDPVQTANMATMNVMHGPMMAAAMIKDADLAFNCGMIAHHRGAIAMAKVQLAMGKDEASKALAREIVEAQEKEIAEMTAWVGNYEK